MTTMSPKPKNLVDIRTSKGAFAALPRMLDLSGTRHVYFRVRRGAKTFFIAVVILAFVFGVNGVSFFALAPTSSVTTFAAQNDDQRKALETQLKELENQMGQYESTITSYKQQGKTLKSEIDRISAQIAKLSLQIKAVTLSIGQLDDNISSTQTEIKKTEDEIDLTKAAIADLLRNIYESETASVVEILLANPRLSDFFGNINNSLSVKDSLRLSLQKVIALRSDLLDEKDRLAMEKHDATALKVYQDSQKSLLQQTKTGKDDLLTVTKGQESRYQNLLEQTKKTAAQIRSQIFQLLGGGELTFEKAYAFAKQAEGATGVRAAFVLAILNRESALGQNVGRCGYKTSMAPGPPQSKRDDVTPFLQITRELGIAPDSVLVSCANADGAYGGAMGPAQFIPTTWMGYRNRVAQYTGNNPASPWNNADAFVAAALYLKDAGAASNERTAAAKYYCGNNWNRYICLSVYGQRVIENAREFQGDIDILNGQS